LLPFWKIKKPQGCFLWFMNLQNIALSGTGGNAFLNLSLIFTRFFHGLAGNGAKPIGKLLAGRSVPA
jgi:hypothetical protein